MKITKLGFLIILTTFLFIGGKAQEVSQKSADLPLKLTLRFKEGKLCVGKEFKILARMENVSKETQIIDERNLWRYAIYQGPPEPVKETVEFDKLPSGKEFTKLLKIDRFQAAMGDGFPDDDVPREHLITLKPNEFYEDSRIIKKDNDFFRIPGKYFIEYGYGQFADWSSKGVSLFIGSVDSNKLEFTLSDCKKN